MDRFALDFRMDKTLTVYVSSLLGGFLTDKERLIALEWGEWSVWIAMAVLAFVKCEVRFLWESFRDSGDITSPEPGEWRLVTDEGVIREPSVVTVGNMELTTYATLACQPAERLSVEEGDYRAYYGVEQKAWIEERLKRASGIGFSEGKNNDPASISPPETGVKDVVTPLRKAKSTGRKTVARLKAGDKEVWTCGKGKGADKLALKWDARGKAFAVSGKVGGSKVERRFPTVEGARAFIKESMSNETVRQGEKAVA